MILASSTDISEVFAESLEAGLKEAFPTVLKMFWDGLVQCAVDYPLLTGAVVLLILFNWFYPIYKKRKKK